MERFSDISQVLDRVLIEYIEPICSLESELSFVPICSIRIPYRYQETLVSLIFSANRFPIDCPLDKMSVKLELFSTLFVS